MPNTGPSKPKNGRLAGVSYFLVALLNMRRKLDKKRGFVPSRDATI